MVFKNLLILFLLLFSLSLKSQDSLTYYFIYFKDKQNNPFSFQKPEQYLSEKALNKRKLKNIELDSLDLPVTPSYIEQLAQFKELNVLQASKWLNGVKVFFNTNSFDPNKVLVCSNKNKYNYKINHGQLINKNAPLSILLIYEFLADTVAIGEYIKVLMSHGIKIYFKIRPDDSVFNQIRAYQLDDELTSKWTIVDKVNESLMSGIDAVVGTYSTMLFDLYPYGKRILRFDTSFELNDDSLKDYSLKCNLIQLQKFRNLIIPESADLVSQKSSRLNGKVQISETIQEIVNRASI